MKFSLSATVCLILVLACLGSGARARQEASKFETRCGWLSNPTPANMWLQDRDAQWIIGMQGGYQLEGEIPWPEFKRGQWVKTNVGSYGYGCACMVLRVNKDTHEVLEIKSARARPLSACRRDRALKRWKY